ncbi:MAG: hypothetical protein IJO27_00015, partial [Bacilli bacterium]|nr:hypothetical protein [Bacilli bacterium]
GGLVTLKLSVKDSTTYEVEEDYLFNYTYIISTIFGGALCFILLGFCLDLAIRVVKLAFLQVIAPIPIILNISPGSKTNYLQNYGKEVLSTWASLFIRIATVSFAIYMIQLVNQSGIYSFVTGKSSDNIFVTIFVILGLLMFAKEFPKLLENILGMKGTGSLTLNPIKKLNEGMLGGGIIGGAVAGLAGGGIGGAIRGAWAGRSAKSLSEGTKKAASSNVKARQLHEIDPNPIRRGFGRAGAGVSKAIGIESRAERIESQVKDLEEKSKIEQNAAKFFEAQIKTRSDIRSHVLDELENKDHRSTSTKLDPWDMYQKDIQSAKANLDAAQASGNAAAIEAARANYNTVKEEAIDKAINAYSDGYMQTQIDQYNARIKENPDLAKDAALSSLASGANLNKDLGDNKNKAQTAANTRNAEVYRLNEEVRRINADDSTKRAKQYRDSVK